MTNSPYLTITALTTAALELVLDPPAVVVEAIPASTCGTPCSLGGSESGITLFCNVQIFDVFLKDSSNSKRHKNIYKLM